MQIEFQGAARTVTGSMHLLHVNGSLVILDCGLFQGKRDESNQRNRNFPFDPKSVSALVLSHAHIDHSGNIPNLVKQGFAGPVFCTDATKDLCAIMLADSGHIQEKDAEYLNKKLAKKHEPPIQPLYTSQDALTALGSFQAVPYDRDFDVVPGVSARFIDAGHILGSAGIRVTLRSNGSVKTLGFTGDIGRWNLPIIRDPLFMGNVEALISESTYGGKLHDAPEEMGGQLVSTIERTIARGGKIIVPAFSVGRTQDLVYALHTLFDAGKLPRIRIFIDSPLAINATDIYKRHPECYDDETRQHLLNHHDPLGLNQLSYVRSAEESKKLNGLKEPCLIIAASGMCEAGRILHHLANNIQDQRNTILIVGYQADHTLGKKLVDQWEEVSIFGEVYKRNAEVVVLNSFSAHADGNELIKYTERFDKRQLKNIYLVHGEYERQVDFQKSLQDRGHGSVYIPSRGEKFEI